MKISYILMEMFISFMEVILIPLGLFYRLMDKLLLGKVGTQDKIIHITAALSFTFLIAIIIHLIFSKKSIVSIVATSMMISFAIGTILEIAQFAFPSRVVEWQDIVANGIGCILGGAIFAAVLCIKKIFKSIVK